MGLMDRDYMKDRAASRPFRPPPERSLAGTLIVMCALLTGLFVVYKSADRYLLQRSAALKAQSDTHELQTTPAPTRQGAAAPATADWAPPSGVYTAPRPTPGAVTKCVAHGKTSYGDASSCAAGAVASQLTPRSDHNLMDAVPVPANWAEDVETPTAVVVTQTRPSRNATGNQSLCQAWNEEIALLDAQARQPQSGQSQDYLTKRRKEVRDAQFRARC